MTKRIIALLLALILTVGLLPTVALADGGTPAAGTSNDVKNGYYADTTWKEGPLNQGTLPTGVKTVDKTAEKVAGTDNQYKVTLTVVLEQTEEEQKPGAAATVLVLDTSGSMAYCAECGAEPEEDCVHNYVKFDGIPKSSTNYYYKTKGEKVERAYYCDGKHEFRPWLKHPAGWFTTSGDAYSHDPQRDSLAGRTIYVKSETPRTSRLDAAKIAAENFLKTYSGLKFDSNGNLITGQTARNLGRYVSVVTFATGVTLRKDWVDVSDPIKYAEVLSLFTSNNLKADGGTNLDAGLTYAEYLLKKDTVKNATKNVIALTDGEPTYYLSTSQLCSDGDCDCSNGSTGVGTTSYYVHGPGDACSTDTKSATDNAANALKNNNFSDLYTICFGVANDKMKQNKDGNHIKYWPNNLTVGQYLESLASEKDRKKLAYTASNANELNTAFAAITDTIVSGLNTGTVKDTLPTGITSAAFGEGNVKEWKLNEAPFTKNETTNTVDGKQVTTYTYTYTYTVTIDPDNENLVKTEDGYAPLNGKTTLTVKNSQGTDVEIPFPIPAGKVTMPSYTVTWKSQDGSTLETDNDVEYNTKPTFNSDAPTKADDAQYTYTFVGWATEANREIGTPEANLPAVTADVTYYAAFSKTARTYTVTWMPQDGQGNAYETDTGVAYNASPSYDSAEPTKAADAEHTYTFVGWATSANQETGTPEANLPAVTADVTYYAAFSKTPRTYTVTGAIDNSGNVTNSNQTVNAGDSSTAMTFTPAAGYEIKTITEKIGDGQPATITVTNKNSYTYPAKDNVKADITVDVKTAKRSDLKYVVKHVEKDNATNVLATENKTGTLDEVINGEAQKKTFTGFTYVECSPASITISANEDNNVITLYYTRNKHNITYQYESGAPTDAPDVTSYNETNVPYDARKERQPAPSLAGWTFSGWTTTDVTVGTDGKFTMPNKDVVFKGSWTEKDNVTINYVAKTGGTVAPLSETLNPDTGEATGSTAKANDGYRFVGWYSDKTCTTAVPAAWVNSDNKLTPGKPEGGWADATYYAKFEQIQVNVDLSPYVKKTLEVDGTLPTDFSETFKVNVTVDGQLLQQQGTVTMTAAATSNFNMPTVTLTCGVHTIVVQEVVDPQAKNSNIAYGTNPESFVLNVTASGVQYGTTNSDGNFDKVKEPAFVTITNKYTQPTETFDLNTLITKTFEKDPTRESKDIPTGTYTFTAQIFEADDSWQQVGESPVYTGTATLNGAASGAAFDFGSSRNPTLASGTHKYLVKEVNGGVAGITYDPTVYHLTITVNEDGTQPNVQIEAETQASVLSVQPVEFASKITFTNTYFKEKDPNSVTVDFSQYVYKKLTVTGDKAFTGATFEAVLDGEWHDLPAARSLEDASAIATYAHATPGAAQLHKTLTVSFDANDDLTQNKAFTGSITFNAEGVYTYTLKEVIPEGATGYDTSEFHIRVVVEADNAQLKAKVWMWFNDELMPLETGILFSNTIDTGRDDYIPIIIPTIINKDTGMLNKTDHFAYVIGYPDGTVHPNGQITRAEVATIFFRLLRDEVRDGAFTTSNSYSDVAYGKWYNNPISTMSALGIITGYPDGTFKPNKPITRAEFAAIAARFDETQSGKSATFSDVIGHWAAKEIGIAYYNDWIKGYPDGTFKPDQNITRAEAMTLINRVLERKPESPADLLTNMNKWTDNMDTSKWYYLDVQEATNSHGYTRKTFNYELWRQMLPDPDWSRYER